MKNILLVILSCICLSGCCGWAQTGQRIDYPRESSSPTFSLNINRATQRICKPDAPYIISINIYRNQDKKTLLFRRVAIEGLPESSNISEWKVDWINQNEVKVIVYDYKKDEKILLEIFNMTYVYNTKLDEFREQVKK